MTHPRPLFPTSAPLAPFRLATGLVAVCAGALMTGCVGNPFANNPVDPASPVAAEVTKLGRQGGKFPAFASIPNPPKDIRPAAQYGASAKQVIAAGDALIRNTEPGTWTLKDTDAFAEAARRDAGPAIDPAKPGEAEAFAKELRDRATPPPPR